MHPAHRIALTAVALLAVAAPLPVASATHRMPVIHNPRADGGEFAFVDVYIKNSSRRTNVLVCVSDRCRKAQYLGRQRWTAYAGRPVRSGATRTVLVIAGNGSSGSQWGPAPVTFR